MEAPIGVEPMNRGFAIRSLSHLGTAPNAMDAWKHPKRLPECMRLAS